jgi:hypothetical protein
MILFYLSRSPCKSEMFLDVDLEVRVDLQELEAQFDLMSGGQLFGIVTDQAKAAWLTLQDFILQDILVKNLQKYTRN